MKIKIIDLLNKISNGEKIPKKIKYGKDTYIHIDNYCYYCEDTNLILSDRIFAEYSKLNDEIEIIEEDKKIEKLDIKQEKNIKNNWKWKLNNYCISTPQKIMADKINELIDEINNLKEK